MVRKCLSLMGIFLICGAVIISAEEKKSEDKSPLEIGFFTLLRPSSLVLFDTGYGKELSKHGMEGDAIFPYEDVGNWWKKYFGMTSEQIYEKLRPFHVIFYYESYRENPKPAEMSKIAEALERYVSEGGGLFVCARIEAGYVFDLEAVPANFNTLFGKFGARMLQEGVWDPDHAYKAESLLRGKIGKQFFYTENFSPHPVTQNLRRLYLPQFGKYTSAGTIAVELDKNWEVVVRGEKTAKSWAIAPGECADGMAGRTQFEKVGRYNSEPPVAAVRSFGKGRVFLYSCDATHVFLNYNNANWLHITEFRGDVENRIPSDGQKLVINALKWLGETARENKEIGFHKLAPLPPVKYPESISLDGYKFGAPATIQTRGIIGAHTVLSDGKGTVAEYALKARQQGLSYVAFCESFEKMTEDKFKQLKEECRKSSDDTFYACPGLEIDDSNGCRWAFWGEAFPWPTKDVLTPDGKRLLRWGQYEISAGNGCNALLTYDKLPGDPANLWWFYRLPIYVYEDGKLLADNERRWFSAFSDARQLEPVVYTRLHSPESLVGIEKQGLNVSLQAWDIARVRKFLNIHFGDCGIRGNACVSQGPRVTLWESCHHQTEDPILLIRGAQRVWSKFVVESDSGLKEVIVHDGNRGPARRYLCHGAKVFSREFEQVHDRQHYLCLEVVDEAGRKAFSPNILIFCYKAGFYRCSDNLNSFGASGMFSQPAWHRCFPEFRFFEHSPLFSINGVDGFDVVECGFQPLYTVRTEEGTQPRKYGPALQQPLRIPFTSYNVSMFTMQGHNLMNMSNNFGPNSSFIPVLEETEFADFDLTAYNLMSRLDYFTMWDWQQLVEGIKDYKGGIIVHEGKVRFKRDATLKGNLPIQIGWLSGTTDIKNRSWDQVYVSDAKRGALGYRCRTGAENFQAAGDIAPGGYLGGMNTQVGYMAFLTSSEGGFRYDFGSKDGKLGFISFGLGENGRKVKKGEEMRYRFIAATVANPKDELPSGNDMLDHLCRVFNLNGKNDGYPYKVEAGKFTTAEVFFTVQAERNEAVFTCGPAKSIIDMPVKVEGIEDNGCAAVYVTNGKPHEKRFRFVAVQDGAALFQQAFEDAPRMWAGNVFAADDKSIKVTLVVDGQAPGAPPFIEVHNPTDKPVTTKLFSPVNTPVFGGISAAVTIPAGDSAFLVIKDRALLPRDAAGNSGGAKN